MDEASKGRSWRQAAGGTKLPKKTPGERKLLELVQAEIIPRLMLAHRGQRPETSGTGIDAAHVEQFAQALMARSAQPAKDLLDVHLDRGVGLHIIFLHLLAPTAHYLGELWEADECNFSQVTLCLWRLQSMLHDLSPSFQSASERARSDRSAERRILMTTMTGQQHTFGLSILSEFFRREGWVVLSIPSPEPGETQSTL